MFTNNLYIYVDIYVSMAKAIMISNDVYKDLSDLKGERSFSEVLREVLQDNKIKKGFNLKKCFGLIKNDKEGSEVSQDLERGWKNWSKKYV